MQKRQHLENCFGLSLDFRSVILVKAAWLFFWCVHFIFAQTCVDLLVCSSNWVCNNVQIWKCVWQLLPIRITLVKNGRTSRRLMLYKLKSFYLGKIIGEKRMKRQVLNMNSSENILQRKRVHVQENSNHQNDLNVSQGNHLCYGFRY